MGKNEFSHDQKKIIDINCKWEKLISTDFNVLEIHSKIFPSAPNENRNQNFTVLFSLGIQMCFDSHMAHFADIIQIQVSFPIRGVHCLRGDLKHGLSGTEYMFFE